MLELIQSSKPLTAFMSFGDSIRIEMLDSQGNSLFGAIDQTVKQYTKEAK
jgi:fumarylacetoacetate (FAA) hydrolase